MKLNELFEKRAKLYEELAAIDVMIATAIMTISSNPLVLDKDDRRIASFNTPNKLTNDETNNYTYVIAKSLKERYKCVAGPYRDEETALAFIGSSGNVIVRIHNTGKETCIYYWSDPSMSWRAIP